MQWLLLVYKIPREPTAGRVYVWRKLKQLGAVTLQDAVWVLPANSRTHEQLQWLSAEIHELNGESTLFTSELISAEGSSSLKETFEAPVHEEYETVLRALRKKKPDLNTLSKQYLRAKERDFFNCKLGEQVRQKLVDAKGKNES
jgi:DNA-binding transcriptional regulator PaaX